MKEEDWWAVTVRNAEKGERRAVFAGIGILTLVSLLLLFTALFAVKLPLDEIDELSQRILFGLASLPFMLIALYDLRKVLRELREARETKKGELP